MSQAAPAPQPAPVDSQGRALVQCKWCPAFVRWVRMVPSGKRNPLDPEPDPRGNVILSKTNDALAKALKRDEPYEGERYISHWSTCPGAQRRKGKTAPADVRNPSGSE